MNKLNTLAYHTINQALSPDTDKDAWLAFQILKVRYPSLTYQSRNGYHCDGLVNYMKGVQWNDNEIIDVKARETLLTTNKPFYNSTTDEIVNTWMSECVW